MSVQFVIARVSDNTELVIMADRDEADALARIITQDHGYTTVVYPKESDND